MRLKVLFRNGEKKSFKVKEDINLGENDYKGFIILDNGVAQLSKKEICYIKIKGVKRWRQLKK